MIGALKQRLFQKQFLLRSLWFFLFLGLTIFAHRNLLNKFPLAYGDLSTFPKNSQQAFDVFFFAWKDQGLGLYRSPGYVFPFLQGVFLLIFPNTALAQMAFMGTSLSLGYLIIGHVLRRYLKIGSEFLVFVLSVLYVYSPIMTGEFMGGTFGSTIIAFLIFPLLYLWTIDLIRHPNIANGVKLFLLLGTVLSINQQMIVIYPISLFIPATISVVSDLKILWRWSLLGLIFLSTFLFSAVFFFDSFGFVASKSIDGTTSNFTNSSHKFLSEVHYTYAASNFTNVLRVGGFINPMNYSKNNIYFIPFITLVVFSVIYSVFTFKKNKNPFRVSILPSFIFFSILVALTGYRLTDEIFLNAPVLFLFRNPAKLTALSTFFLVLTIGSLANALLDKFNNSLRVTLLLCILAAISLYIWPTFIGDRGLVSIAKNDNISIPSRITEASQLLDELRGGSDYPRSIWLPGSHEQTAIKLYWLDPNKLEAETGIAEFSDDYFDGSMAKILAEDIINKNTEGFRRHIRDAGIGYLILLNDNTHIATSQSSYGAISITSGSKAIEKIAMEAGFSLLNSSKEFSVFETKDYLPLLTTMSLGDCFGNSDCRLDKEIQYFKINSSDYAITLPAGAPKKLIFNQSFHNGWKIRAEDKGVSDQINSSHARNGVFSNQWVLPEFDKPTQLRLYFQPQEYLDLSLLMGASCYIFGSIALIIASIKSNNKHDGKN